MSSKPLVSPVSLRTCLERRCTTVDRLATRSPEREDRWATLSKLDRVECLDLASTLLPVRCPVCQECPRWVPERRTDNKFLKVSNSASTPLPLPVKVLLDPTTVLDPTDLLKVDPLERFPPAVDRFNPLLELVDPLRLRKLLDPLEPLELDPLDTRRTRRLETLERKKRTDLDSPPPFSPTLLLKNRSRCSVKRKSLPLVFSIRLHPLSLCDSSMSQISGNF